MSEMRRDAMTNRRKRSRCTTCLVAALVITFQSYNILCKSEATNDSAPEQVSQERYSRVIDPAKGTDRVMQSAEEPRYSSGDNYFSLFNDYLINKAASEEYNQTDGHPFATIQQSANSTLHLQRDMQNDLRELNADAERYGWRKFSVVVAYANPVYVPNQPAREAGHLYVADEFVYNTKQNDSIGRMYQRCILLPPGGTADPNPNLLECVWQFELQLRSSQPGNIMLQGTFFDDGLPATGGTIPDKQYFGIVGGTGAFTSVYGVARFKPLNLNASPPTFCYTFYVKLG